MLYHISVLTSGDDAVFILIKLLEQLHYIIDGHSQLTEGSSQVAQSEITLLRVNLSKALEYLI